MFLDNTWFGYLRLSFIVWINIRFEARTSAGKYFTTRNSENNQVEITFEEPTEIVFSANIVPLFQKKLFSDFIRWRSYILSKKFPLIKTFFFHQTFEKLVTKLSAKKMQMRWKFFQCLPSHCLLEELSVQYSWANMENKWILPTC